MRIKMDDFGQIEQSVAQSVAQILPTCGEFGSDKAFVANPPSSQDGGGEGRMGPLKNEWPVSNGFGSDRRGAG
jgi:hypothetical protein